MPDTPLPGPVLTSLALPPGLTVAEGFTGIATFLGDTIQRTAPAISDGAGDPTPVHQTRVATRRLRSALAIFRPAIDVPETQALNEALRDFARTLGPAREWDVFLAGTATRVAALFPAQADMEPFLAACTARRDAAYRDLTVADALPIIATSIAALTQSTAWRDTLPADTQSALDAPLEPFAATILRRRHRRVRRAGRHFKSLESEALHELRLAGKRLRYAAEFFAGLFDPPAASRYIRRLTRLQDRLGEINDDSIIARLLAELEPADTAQGFAAGAVRGYIAGTGSHAGQLAAQTWKRFRRLPPFWS